MKDSNESDWQNADFLTLDQDQVGDDDNYDDGRGMNHYNNNDDGDNYDDARTISNTNNLPPWMSGRAAAIAGTTKTAIHTSQHVNPLVRLHNEIVDFCSLMEPTPEELLKREQIVERFRSIAHTCFDGNHDTTTASGNKCQVLVFGSQATGLLLPTSDIDVVILLKEDQNDDDNQSNKDKDHHTKDSKSKSIMKEREDMEQWEVTTASFASSSSSSKSPLHRLATALREEWLDELEYLEVIEKTRVPLVKLTTVDGISIDVCFNQENGPKAAQLMKTYLQAMPPLRPLTFVMKYFLASRGLNEPYSGGIGSFLLQLMIVSFLQHRERDGFNYKRPSAYNLGCLLVEFLELYGMDMNYVTTGISVRHDGFYFPKGALDRKDNYYIPSRPFSLAVENPLDPTMDVGKGSFKIQTIQRSFDVAFKVLLAHVTEPAIFASSILASILPTSHEMHLRTIGKKGDHNRHGNSIAGGGDVRRSDTSDMDDDMRSPSRKRQRQG